MLQWIVAETEQSSEDGIRFMCRYAEDLGVPYKWSTIMTLLEYSIYDKGFMIALDDDGQVRGVLAYSFWVGDDGADDRSRIEVNFIYLEAGYRRGRTLLNAMDALVQREIELHEPILEIRFYCTPTDDHKKLFGKIATLINMDMHPCGMLSFYATTPDRLSQYVDRHRSSNKCSESPLY
ncbi:hypothetical protein [Paenibacillus periandrae]|uniref:hypothetical protein n=1 Tax=Paenibacillus periandrae TaxID=1761741 RepID=UPI001F09FF58|nr:hypothetical protein [Paenibacillus periandrae]